MLSPEKRNVALKARAEKYFQRKLKAKSIKVTTACFAGFSLALILAISFGILNLWTTLASILIAGTIGFLLILKIFPTKEHTDKTFSLMLRAMEDPSIVQSSSLTKVTLNAEDGAVTLDPVFLDVWLTILAPHLFSNHQNTLKEIRRHSARVQRNNQLGESKVKEQLSQLKQKQAKISAEENKMKEHLLELQQKQAKIAAEENKLKEREEQLHNAESMIIDQLTEIERTQEEVAVMRECAEENASDGNLSSAKVKELEAKERALAQMEAQLQEDREIVSAQKTELNQLKGELISNSDSGASPGDEVVQLKQRIKELEEAKEDLDERAAYVQSVEEQLIDQLNALTEREAAVEQKEINAGMRVG
jgi:hypothetical protein